MQKQQRFVADQRLDLPQYDSMLALIGAEFGAYNSQFFSPLNRILKSWLIANNGGLQVKVDQSVDSILFNSERTDHETMIVWKTTDDALLLTLADNATNYVEVQIVTQTCAPDTVAVWDTTANGNVGEEFTQTVDTITEEHPVLVSNTIAFSGDPDKLPLAIVTTSGGVITTIDNDARNMLFHVDSDWNFGVTRTDKTIDSAKASYDALATAIKELKGTSNWYDQPFAGTKLLKEYQNMFFSGGGDIEFEGTQGSDTLGWNASIIIEIADRPNTYSIAAGSVSLLDGQAMYVDIPEGASPPLVPQIALLSDVPIDPASVGFSPRLQVLFFRRGSTVYGLIDIPEIDSGEVAQIGQDLPQAIRSRIGITSESSYEAYTSTFIIGASDTYPQALSKLDAAVNLALSDTAIEEDVIATAAQTIVNFNVLNFNPSNLSYDLKVYLDGNKQKQDPAGTLLEHYRKISATSIEMAFPLLAGEKVTGRMEDAAVVVLGPQPYFVNYFTGLTGAGIGTGNPYNTGTDRLSVYRNGAYMVESASLVFAAVERYQEASSSSVLFGFGLIPADWVAFVNDDADPSARSQVTGLAGTVLTVPAYTVGNDTLRVYRNGLLMNAAGLGSAADQYAETSSTQITLATASIGIDVWTFFVDAAPPTFRQDSTTLTGTVQTLPSPITVGNKRLLVFKNGLLMVNSLSVGSSAEQYQETSTTQITLAAAALATDVFTYIYQ